MMAVNLGTGTPKDAVELLEYCNGDMHLLGGQAPRKRPRSPQRQALVPRQRDGRPLADLLRRPREYGRIACETAKLMNVRPTTIEDRRLRQLLPHDADVRHLGRGGPPPELSLRRLSVRSIGIIRTMGATS